MTLNLFGLSARLALARTAATARSAHVPSQAPAGLLVWAVSAAISGRRARATGRFIEAVEGKVA